MILDADFFPIPFVYRFLLARNDIVLYSLLLLRLNREAAKPQLPRSINPFEKLAE